MLIRFLLFFILILTFSCTEKEKQSIVNFPTHFEQTQGTETATYAQTIEFYIQLAKEFSEINIQTIGLTDSGEPLHIVTYNVEGDFNFRKLSKEKLVLLINNGIHPGESDGIDATMLLFRDLATNKIDAPEKTVLVTIPIYNIGGALNRNTGTRANQNGPKSYGFRGNTKNYDLNRDFIKSDSKNARSFAKIFHLVNPDIFIDNHVSNGADYQYTLTHLFTQHNKLGGQLGTYLNSEMMPSLEKSLMANNWEITPYVNVFNQVPETGFSQFIDHPRYSTGYTTLWNTFGLMVETHMLKPYKQRVEGTYELMKQVINIAETDGAKIKELRNDALTRHQNWSTYPIQWAVDSTQHTTLNFKGYQGDTIISKVTGFSRLKYNRNKPFTKEIKYQNYFKAIDSVVIPEAYIIKKGYDKIINLLDLNQIVYKTIKADTILEVESYKIQEYKSRINAYEGHYLHYDTKVAAQNKSVHFSKGDYLIITDQPGFRYLMETLEPAAVDSFFNWNFFDAILQQKEDFSPYVFEDEAEEMLKNDTQLNQDFNLKKEEDLEFKSNWHAQLTWLYKKSNHYEAAHLQYPVYRILKNNAKSVN
ncbi:M14 family metallopeptidase [Aurantibacter crassamenti]|uniref:M14 family metallopeptidase n=1 Tax=Aurantibacter crassamenti TaxID=1837375 RepID=UPI001939B84D|nr:M14 family metallopeptidase [Aurantibacter crassamenti]MBM1108012.1 M14 family metallopeptidase [Aurantibacter crassamenti]